MCFSEFFGFGYGLRWEIGPTGFVFCSGFGVLFIIFGFVVGEGFGVVLEFFLRGRVGRGSMSVGSWGAGSLDRG